MIEEARHAVKTPRSIVRSRWERRGGCAKLRAPFLRHKLIKIVATNMALDGDVGVDFHRFAMCLASCPSERSGRTSQIGGHKKSARPARSPDRDYDRRLASPSPSLLRRVLLLADVSDIPAWMTGCLLETFIADRDPEACAYTYIHRAKNIECTWYHVKTHMNELHSEGAPFDKSAAHLSKSVSF